MKLAWATDIHLDSVELPDVIKFCAKVRQSKATAILISGDIANSTCLEEWIEFLGSHLELPIYFVLGNHDYYGSSIEKMQDVVRDFSDEQKIYLQQSGPVKLTENLSIVGNDGWGDCRLGDLENFEFLTDYVAIRDLREKVNQRALRMGDFESGWLKKKLGELGDEAAGTLRPHLIEATKASESVLVLTHVPPFRESCWHNGTISGDTWLPGFTCKAIGDLLISVAESNPETSYTVLCGHTHGFGQSQILPNLVVHTGFGDYGSLSFGSVRLAEERVIVKGPTAKVQDA